MGMFESRIATDERKQAAVKKYIKKTFSFEPTLEFEHLYLDQQLLYPWGALKEIIPDRINRIIESITSTEGESK